MKIIILENIRSAYNVGNIIRTADALGRQIRLTGYTPSPMDNKKVVKTSLWAEESVDMKQFDTTQEAIAFAKKEWCRVVAAEITSNATSLDEIVDKKYAAIALIFWNEVDGVLDSTLKTVDEVCYIPMKWVKESLNVWQSSAIFMWALVY